MRSGTSSERGMSLIEALIATAILAIVILAVLGIYDAARGAFKKGENATTQQEAVRIAYDRLTADLRMLGYNTNPDGDSSRPDEQLEVGLDHAIIFRGDFDAEDNGKKNDVETQFATGGKFAVVSTGNDEIVGYVLSKPDGTGPDSITFKADVADKPRQGNLVDVTIDNIVLNPTSPPYTLYKVSLNNDVTKFNTSAFVVRTPVVDNIRNLTFQYYDSTSSAAVAAPGSDEAAATKAERNAITKFNVSLIGMTKDPDMNYNDTSDPASRTYRKFELKGDVVPRNMRLKGVQDLNAVTTPPSQPALPSLIAGHCGGLLVTWTLNPTREAVTNYKINYGTTAGSPTATLDAPTSPYFLAGLTTGTTYYVTLQAVNTAGLISGKSGEANATVANTNTPSAPTGASATTNLINFVRTSFTAVTTNTASVPAGDPAAPTIRDLKGYRLYRGDTSSFTASTSTRIADESLMTPAMAPPYNDTSTINCHTYYYKVSAVDTCGTESAISSAFSGKSTTTIAPNPPTNVNVSQLSASRNQITWTPPTKDTAGNPIQIGAYDVYRSDVGNKNRPISQAVWPTSPIGSSSTTSFTDNAVPSMNASQSVYYAVKSKDECVNYSALSDAAQGLCTFTGTVGFTSPAANSNVAGVVSTTVTATGTDTYTGVTITYTHATAGVTRTYTSNTNGTSWTDNAWLASPPGVYTITAVVTNSTGCTSTYSIGVTAGSSVGCCLTVFPTTTTTATCAGGSTKCKEVSYRIGNSQCLTAVSVTSMNVTWTDYTNTKPVWSTAKANGVLIAGSGSWTTTYGTGTNPAGNATKGSLTGTTVPYTPAMTNGNTTNITYVFNSVTDSGSGSNRVVDVFTSNQYVFTLLDSAGNASGVTTSCTLPPSGGLTVN